MDVRKHKIRRLTCSAVVASAVLFVGLAQQSAVAQFKTVEEFVEITPSNMILPRTVNGMMSFRPCVGQCEEKYRRARLTPETRFFVGERAVGYKDFQASFSRVRNDARSYALLSVETKTITITSIRIQG